MIRILVVDDHAIVRAGLRMLLNAQPDMEVVGEAAGAGEALARAAALAPDLVLMDLNLRDGSGVQAIKQLRQHCPQARALALTMHDEPALLSAVLAAGGAGYVTKTSVDTELLTAIRAVHRGRVFVDLSLDDGPARRLLGGKRVRHDDAERVAGDGLSAREREVLVLLAEGHTNQEAAERLFLSVKTVETYRARVAEKLGLHSRADFTRYALESGLLGHSPWRAPVPQT